MIDKVNQLLLNKKVKQVVAKAGRQRIKQQQATGRAGSLLLTVLRMGVSDRAPERLNHFDPVGLILVGVDHMNATGDARVK